MNILTFLGEMEIIVILIIVVTSVLTLIDILESSLTRNTKLTWVFVVLSTGLIGAIIYFILQRSQKSNENS